LDDNCNGQIDEGVKITFCRDSDGDGYGICGVGSTKLECTKPSGYVTQSGDCNDAKGDINPGATEICDTKDNDCDGLTDEGLMSVYYPDGDADGYGVNFGSITDCKSQAGYASQSGDCQDANPAINPGATEVCDNKDNDCDSMVDENLGQTTCGLGECTRTVQNCVSGVPRTCTPGTPIPEVCDGKDNNCNGTIDEGC
jgi:hypothetical protein